MRLVSMSHALQDSNRLNVGSVRKHVTGLNLRQLVFAAWGLAQPGDIPCLSRRVAADIHNGASTTRDKEACKLG